MTALSKTRRRILLYGLISLFLIAAPFVIFYSIGIFVDIRSRTLMPTGGIFIKTNITGAKVFLNNALAKENSFLSHGALLNNVSQGSYTLRVEKEKYRPWQKKVEVTNGLVSEYRTIFLIPKEPPETTIFQITAPHMAITTIAPPIHNIAIATISENEDNQLFLLDTANDIVTPSGIKHVFKTKLSPSGQKLLLKKTEKGITNWAIANTSKNTLRISASIPSQISYLTGETIKMVTTRTSKAISFHPLDETKLYIQDSQNNLLLYDTVNQKTTFISSNVNSFYPTESGIFFLDKNGFLATSDFPGEEIRVLDNKGLFLNNVPSKFIFSSVNNALGIIDQGGGFFIWSDASSELRTLARDTTDALFSPDGTKLAFWNKQTIKTLWLKNDTQSPFEKAGEIKTIFKTNNKEEILDITWLDDNQHILSLTNKRIILSEIDSRGGISATTIIDVNANHFFYNPDNKKIYWVNKNLLRSISLE